MLAAAAAAAAAAMATFTKGEEEPLMCQELKEHRFLPFRSKEKKEQALPPREEKGKGQDGRHGNTNPQLNNVWFAKHDPL